MLCPTMLLCPAMMMTLAFPVGVGSGVGVVFFATSSVTSPVSVGFPSPCSYTIFTVQDGSCTSIGEPV